MLVIAFWGSLNTEIFALVLVNVALIGFCLLPVLGIGYEFGGIMTYPIGEGTVGGLINFGG